MSVQEISSQEEDAVLIADIIKNFHDQSMDSNDQGFGGSNSESDNGKKGPRPRKKVEHKNSSSRPAVAPAPLSMHTGTVLKTNKTFRRRYSTLRRYSQDGPTVYPADINNGIPHQPGNSNEPEFGYRWSEVRLQDVAQRLRRARAEGTNQGTEALPYLAGSLGNQGNQQSKGLTSPSLPPCGIRSWRTVLSRAATPRTCGRPCWVSRNHIGSRIHLVLDGRPNQR